MLSATADFWQPGDLVGIIHHVKHLVGVVPNLAVLLLAVATRRAALVVTGDSLAMLSRPFCHLDRFLLFLDAFVDR